MASRVSNWKTVHFTQLSPMYWQIIHKFFAILKFNKLYSNYLEVASWISGKYFLNRGSKNMHEVIKNFICTIIYSFYLCISHIVKKRNSSLLQKHQLRNSSYIKYFCLTKEKEISSWEGSIKNKNTHMAKILSTFLKTPVLIKITFDFSLNNFYLIIKVITYFLKEHIWLSNIRGYF